MGKHAALGGLKRHLVTGRGRYKEHWCDAAPLSQEALIAAIWF